MYRNACNNSQSLTGPTTAFEFRGVRCYMRDYRLAETSSFCSSRLAAADQAHESLPTLWVRQPFFCLLICGHKIDWSGRLDGPSRLSYILDFTRPPSKLHSYGWQLFSSMRPATSTVR